jgi:hypothetical protein
VTPPRRPYRGQPLHWPWRSPCTHAHFPAHAVAHAPLHGIGHQHRRRADAAAPTPAMASRDGHHPGLAPLRAQQPRSFLEVTPFWPIAQAPWRPPPARSSHAAVSLSCAFHRTLGGTIGFTAWGCVPVTTCGRSHSRSAGIRCGSAVLSSATRQPTPRQAARFPSGSPAATNGGPATRGPREG